jgi:type II secretory pathway component GspD/PulD (secretin)
MKSIATLLSFLALAATSAIVTAQTNTTTVDSAPPAVAAAPAAPAAAESATAPAPAAAPAALPDAATAAGTTSPASATLVAAVAPAAPGPDTAAAPTAPAAEAHDPNAVIPLIVMDEVPLTDAIKNLARQANLNYMLDPKINYGAADANGVVHQAPSISLRWENLTANQALNAVLTTYNLTMNEDPKTHIALISIKDPAAPDPLVTKIIQLKYSSSSNMVFNSTSVLTDKRSKVIGDNRTSQLVVVATEKEIASIDELVARLDTPTRQVLIEAKLVETSSNPTTSKGVDWSGTLQAQHFSFGNGQTTGVITQTQGNTAGAVAGAPGLTPALGATPGTTTTTPSLPPLGTTAAPFVGGGSAPLGAGTTSGNTFGQVLTTLTGNGGFGLNTASGLNPTTAFLNADGVNAVLSFLNTSADAQILSTPRAVTLDNEEATLSVTTAQPIFETTAGTQGSPGGSQVTYTNLGTILKVTPRISANQTISLTVIPEVSDLGPVVTKTVAGLVNQADSFTVRRVVTKVLIPSGNTLVMGGLVTDSTSKGDIKVPILGDIPVLGWAFHQQNKTQNKANLIIFITPTIVHDDDFQPTESTFLKTKSNIKEAADFTAWDSGVPQDWSKLTGSKKDTAASTSADSDIVWPTAK